MSDGTLAPSGKLGLRKVSDPPLAPTWWQITKAVLPTSRYRLRNLPNVWRGYWRISIAYLFGIPTFFGMLRLRLRQNGRLEFDEVVSLRVVTDAGVNYIVDAFQNTTEVENLKYHGFGTGGGAEAAGNTALTTELTTEYASDNVRPTGTTTEGAAANIYRTVATLDPDSAVAITEHGIFSQAATGGGTLLDRSLFSTVNVAASGDTLEATYDLTLTSGS